MAKTYYLFDELGRYAGTSAQQTAFSTPIKPDVLQPCSNWNGYEWVQAPKLVEGLPPSHQATQAAAVVTVSPPEFKLLWTAEERIAIAQVRGSADPAFAQAREAFNDFFNILDDVRLTHVNLSLASTQAGVSAVLATLAGMGVVTDIDARRAAILSGAIQ